MIEWILGIPALILLYIPFWAILLAITALLVLDAIFEMSWFGFLAVAVILVSFNSLSSALTSSWLLPVVVLIWLFLNFATMGRMVQRQRFPHITGNAIITAILFALIMRSYFNFGFWTGFGLAVAFFFAYVFLGMGTARGQWRLHLRKESREMLEKKATFLTNKKVNFNEATGKELMAFAIPAEHTEAWDEYCRDERLYKTSVIDNKALIISWIVSWPGILLQMLFSEIFQIWWDYVYDMFYEMYSKALRNDRDAVFAGDSFKFKEDLHKNPLGPRRTARNR